MKLLEVIKAVKEKVAPGVSPSYTEAHVLLALESIHKYGSLGRLRLSKILGVGEGSTRTMVRRLVNVGLVKISKGGIFLTSSGERLIEELKRSLSDEVKVPRSSITLEESNVAVLVRRASHAVGRGLEQRDAAIKMGASGATTLIYEGGELLFPGMEESEYRDDPIYELLVSSFKPRDGDVIVIGSAKSGHLASLGVKAATIELLKKLEDEAEV